MSDFVQSLKRSAADRAAMLKRFGCMPLSVLRISRGELSRSMHSLQSERPDTCYKPTNDLKTEAAQQRFRDKQRAGVLAMSNRCRANTQRQSYSIMPAELVAFFIKYYARPGDVYLDPFMGQGVQMQVAHRLGLHYYGYDCCRDFVAFIDAVRKRIDNGTTTLHVTCGDSRTPTEVPDGVGDFAFTSPPYWDIEHYGDEPEQLGNGTTYTAFLEGMEEVARAWRPKHKPGSYHVVNVNDFRRKGAMYPYHADVIKLYQRAGWTMHDVWIIDGLVGGLPKAFAVQKNQLRIAPKVHEYALVFRP